MLLMVLVSGMVLFSLPLSLVKRLTPKPTKARPEWEV